MNALTPTKEDEAEEVIRTPRELGVEIAGPADLDEMMKLTIAASHENGFVEPNPLKLLREVYPALHLQDGIVGVIRGEDNRIEAAILLRIGEIWYSDAKMLEEKAIFVDPKFRQAKGGRASRLCEFSKYLAKKLDMPMTIGVLSNERTEAKVRMYMRQFGKYSGVYFLFNAKTGAFSI
jgi:hypothetical protein